MEWFQSFLPLVPIKSCLKPYWRPCTAYAKLISVRESVKMAANHISQGPVHSFQAVMSSFIAAGWWIIGWATWIKGHYPEGMSWGIFFSCKSAWGVWWGGFTLKKFMFAFAPSSQVRQLEIKRYTFSCQWRVHISTVHSTTGQISSSAAVLR
jgi:hypothetical protein